MKRIYNFAAGPSMLPQPVLEKAQKELLNYNNTGMSVMEMSHRSKTYDCIIEEAKQHLRELMKVPDNYSILFLQGGATTQFAMVPLNLLNGSGKADYIVTGNFAKKALSEAKRYGNINVPASSEDKKFSYIPNLDKSTFTPDADYFHITTNNTIFGTRYTEIPDIGNVPLAADMSSNILSEVIDISKFGIIYAGAQKNLGPAGVTVVIIRKDLIGNALDFTPTMMNYKTHEQKSSMYNTPPTYSIYIVKLVLEWLKQQGGISEIQKRNEEKSQLLYDFLDNSGLFKPTAAQKDRSIMNVTSVLPTSELNAKFVNEAEKNGLGTLKGHRLVGGIRASIYNAMPLEGVKKLVGFMKKFETENK